MQVLLVEMIYPLFICSQLDDTHCYGTSHKLCTPLSEMFYVCTRDPRTIYVC